MYPQITQIFTNKKITYGVN